MEGRGIDKRGLDRFEASQGTYVETHGLVILIALLLLLLLPDLSNFPPPVKRSTFFVDDFEPTSIEKYRTNPPRSIVSQLFHRRDSGCRSLNVICPFSDFVDWAVKKKKKKKKLRIELEDGTPVRCLQVCRSLSFETIRLSKSIETRGWTRTWIGSRLVD